MQRKGKEAEDLDTGSSEMLLAASTAPPVVEKAPPAKRNWKQIGIISGVSLLIIVIIILIIVTARHKHVVEPPAPFTGTRIILSTDCATGLANGSASGLSDIDDGFTVAMALNLPNLQVTVATVFGNNAAAPETQVAEMIVYDFFGRYDVPIAQGATIAGFQPPVAWYNGTLLPNNACINDGVRLMAAALENGTSTLVAIGPLTDVACLLTAYPESAVNITEIVVIMGRAPNETFQFSGITVRDFNFALDVDSAAAVLNSGVKVVCMTFSLTSSSLFTDVAGLGASGHGVQFFRESAQAWIDFWYSVSGEPGYHPWDQNALYYGAVNKAAFSCAPLGFQIVPCPLAPGYAPCARDEPAQLWLDASYTQSPQVTACTAYASAASKAQFLQDLVTYS